ncbi:MAG: small multi-drug export protein [Clostridia bacterium]|nr:small multi-drug export protein [Clostridia bacterium]
MTAFLNNLFATVFNDNVILATILIATLPVIELRGAIPFATNPGFWGSFALNNWSAFGWSLLGSSAIVPIIALIFLPLINWLKKTKLFSKLALAIENRVKSKTSNIENAEEKSVRFSKAYWKKMLAVFIFVAVPLPFTGVWTGTCVAVFVGLDYLSTCTSVIAGNIVAGLLVTLILEFFPWLNGWLFYIFLILIAVIIIYELIRYFIKKRKAQKETQE